MAEADHMNPTITFDYPQVLYAYKAAGAKARYFRKLLKKTALYPNHPQGHFVGRLGEMAAYRWFKENGLGPKANFHFERNDLPDIDLYRTKQRVEVKSWRAFQFDELGCAVHLGQFARIMEKADVLVWASVKVERYERYDTVDVELAGWNYVDDLQEARPVNLGGFENIQLPRAQVRLMESLFHLARGRVVAR
jgi:hypothetical protein